MRYLQKSFLGLAILIATIIASGNFTVWAAYVTLDDPISTKSNDQDAKAQAGPKDAAVERARREVQMIDTIYKTSIVLITEHYVNEEDDLPAGEAFKLLFDTMTQKGFHEVKLLDATGEPYNDDNAPKAGFEQAAVKKLVTGETVYDEVVTENGKRFLNSATAIPVVMKKCVMCHDNYEDVPAGRAIGAMRYKIPIDDTPVPAVAP